MLDSIALTNLSYDTKLIFSHVFWRENAKILPYSRDFVMTVMIYCYMTPIKDLL